MDREQRAKQFAPFDALSGLGQAIRDRERKHEQENKREISEEKTAEISETLSVLDKGDTADVKFFLDGYYVTLRGEITKIDFIKKFLILEEGKILFTDIYDIKKV